MTLILQTILCVVAILGLLTLLIPLFKLKVWIFTKTGGEKRLSNIGFMSEGSDGEVPEVHLAADARGKAIGRVKLAKDGNTASVELLTSGLNDDSSKPSYRTYGFVSRDGLIYKQVDNNKKPVVIGYTACKSNPEQPTIHGERSWKTLWLKSTLEVYPGLPENMPENSANKMATLVFNDDVEPSDSNDAESADSTEDPSDNNASDDSKNEESIEEQENKNEQNNKVGEKDDKKKRNKGSKKKNKNKSKDSKQKNIKLPVGRATFTSFRSTKNDPMPLEARSAAFGLLFSLYNKQNYKEYYNSPSFGWKDTALLSAFIYTLLYIVWYIISLKVLRRPFIGENDELALYVLATYFPLWAIVREAKIECVERSSTIQPKIDLFNKVLGQKKYDIAILICCGLTLLFTGYYNYDFLPLALVLIIAVIINFSLKASNRRWVMKNPLEPEEEDSPEDEEKINPPGDIERTYEWILDSDKQRNIQGKLALYFYGQYITDLRFVNPFYNQRKDKPVRILVEEMFNYLIEHKSVTARMRYIVSYIKRTAAQRQFDEEDTLQFTLDFVQEPNIRFTMNRDSAEINRFEDYIRFPDEVLYDKEGDANSKVMLAVMLFHFLGHEVVFLHSRVQHFGALGIKVRQSWIDDSHKIFGRDMEKATFEYNGKRYLFCEVTSDGFRIGEPIYGMDIDDFDDRIELRLTGNADDNNADSRTCIYNWDLDSAAGNVLSGHFTLEFDNEDMTALRNKNPFLTYGRDGEEYHEKIEKMFDYYKNTTGANDNVRRVAEYIRKTVSDAGLPEFDLVQFALDFCQAPNITYRVDNESAGINFAEEYMRFPDEVLFDKEGDCDCKSSLTAALLKELGYNVVILLSKTLQHAGIAVEFNPDWRRYIQDDEDKVLRVFNGRTYLYCETTGDGFKVGQIDKNQSIQEFETVVEI